MLEAVDRGREAAGKEVRYRKWLDHFDIILILHSAVAREGYVVISGDFDGDIKIFINQTGIC